MQVLDARLKLSLYAFVSVFELDAKTHAYTDPLQNKLYPLATPCGRRQAESQKRFRRPYQIFSTTIQLLGALMLKY